MNQCTFVDIVGDTMTLLGNMGIRHDPMYKCWVQSMDSTLISKLVS